MFNSNLLFVLLFVTCIMMMGFTTIVLVESSSSSCGGGGCSTTNSTSTVQSHWEVLDNSTQNAEIISMRTKQMDRITKSISLLTRESTFLKNISIISNNNNGQQIFEYYGDGSRAKSCREYRNPIFPHQYNGEGSGLYNIEPSNGLLLTVYCDMITDGGGWTLISGITSDYAGIHFHTFEDSTAAISTPTTFTSFHIKTSALLSISTQVRAATDTAAFPATTFYQSSWPYSVYCTITQSLRDAIQISPTQANGDLPAACVVLTGSFSEIPTHFTYGKSNSGHSTGFRMGIPKSYDPGHFVPDKSYATISFTGAPEGTYGNYPGLHYAFGAGNYNRNGAVYLR